MLYNPKKNRIKIKLPDFVLHLPGASGIGGLEGSFMHSNPSSHVPQSKLLVGLKHGPHSSPSFFLVGGPRYEKGV